MYEDALQISPMGVCKLPKNKTHLRKQICSSGEYMAQIKKDGYWYIYEKTLTGSSYLFSRKISKSGNLSEKSANVPHLMNALNKALPNGTILITEIYYPGKTSSSVTEIMGCLPEKAVLRQYGVYCPIHMYIHDILSYDGVSLLDGTNLERNKVLHDVVKKHKLNRISPFIEVAHTWYGKNLDSIIDKALDSGEEGVVLKRKDGLYEPGLSPAWNWIKFKIEDYCDVICIGFEPPTKEYEGSNPDTWGFKETTDTGETLLISKNYAKGWAGALRMGVYKDGQMVDIGEVSAGITDEQFEDIKQHPEKYLNEPMLVRCMNPTEQSLRHSVFLNLRDDINPKDCTWEKIFG